MDDDLECLLWHWGTAYAITHPAPDAWLAQRRDDGGTVRAATPEALRDAILADYLSNPVPR